MIRHRNGCLRSAAVGARNEVILTPCGSTRPMALRMMPPFPDVSIPCKITSTLRLVSSARPLAYRHSCRSASSTPIWSIRPGASSLVSPGKAGRRPAVEVGEVHRARGKSKRLGQRGCGDRQLTVGTALRLRLLLLAHPGIVPHSARAVRMGSCACCITPISDARQSWSERTSSISTGGRPRARGPTVRSNFVATLDGSIQGLDGRSGSINTDSDHEIFALHRALADVILVGAGTVRGEGYRAVDLQPWQRSLRAGGGSGAVSHPGGDHRLVADRSRGRRSAVRARPGDRGDDARASTRRP